MDPILTDWIDKSIDAARLCVIADESQELFRCNGTWFIGVNSLPNDQNGSVNGGLPIDGKAVTFIQSKLVVRDRIVWDRGQVSICYPGYPKPMQNETNANFAYRRDKDGAHVDGLLPHGLERRRFLKEYHGFILGIPMVWTNEGASPAVVWEGSHEYIRSHLMNRYKGILRLSK